MAPMGERTCRDCPAKITGNGNKKICEGCKAEANRARGRARARRHPYTVQCTTCPNTWESRVNTGRFCAACRRQRQLAALARHNADPENKRKKLELHVQQQYERRWRLAKYGLTIEDYERLVEAQGGVCAICGKPAPREQRLVVDHCHLSGQVRGLLCSPCNRAIGQLGDTHEGVMRAANYLSAFATVDTPALITHDGQVAP